MRMRVEYRMLKQFLWRAVVANHLGECLRADYIVEEFRLGDFPRTIEMTPERFEELYAPQRTADDALEQQQADAELARRQSLVARLGLPAEWV